MREATEVCAFVRKNAKLPPGIGSNWLEAAVRLELAFRAANAAYDPDDAIEWVLEQMLETLPIQEEESALAAALIDQVQEALNTFEQEQEHGV